MDTNIFNRMFTEHDIETTNRFDSITLYINTDNMLSVDSMRKRIIDYQKEKLYEIEIEAFTVLIIGDIDKGKTTFTSSFLKEEVSNIYYTDLISLLYKDYDLNTNSIKSYLNNLINKIWANLFEIKFNNSNINYQYDFLDTEKTNAKKIFTRVSYLKWISTAYLANKIIRETLSFLGGVKSVSVKKSKTILLNLKDKIRLRNALFKGIFLYKANINYQTIFSFEQFLKYCFRLSLFEFAFIKQKCNNRLNLVLLNH